MRFLQDRICELARVVEVDLTQPLIAAGIRFAGCVELRNTFETQLEDRLPLERLLGGYSILDVADSVIEQQKAPLPSLRSDVVAGTDIEYSLSYAQQALWMLYKNNPQDAAYVMARAGRIRGPINIDAFTSAFQRVAQRHPCLRTVFLDGGAEPHQVARADSGIGLIVEQATDLAESSLLEKLRADVNRPFDLERGPVMRVEIYRRSDEEHILVLSLHHIVCDLWSFGIIISEIDSFYDEALGLPISLPALSASYQDFVDYQQIMTTSKEGERCWEYWRNELAGQLPVLDLPLDYARPPVPTNRAAEMHFRLQGSLRSDLASLARERVHAVHGVARGISASAAPVLGPGGDRDWIARCRP